MRETSYQAVVIGSGLAGEAEDTFSDRLKKLFGLLVTRECNRGSRLYKLGIG